MEPYKLSVAAALDFENILDFGINTFGHTQALEYQHGMVQRFEELAACPKQAVAVDDIRPGYRRGVYHSHSIYYRIEPNLIFIVRVLGQQELPKALSI
jgi:toxin ParE1/3/4